MIAQWLSEGSDFLNGVPSIASCSTVRRFQLKDLVMCDSIIVAARE
jgi:hypothetical protein